VRAFGVFVEMHGFRRWGLVHLSQLSNHWESNREDSDEQKIDAIKGVVSEGEQIWVKVSAQTSNPHTRSSQTQRPGIHIPKTRTPKTHRARDLESTYPKPTDLKPTDPETRHPHTHNEQTWKPGFHRPRDLESTYELLSF
jgi:predicted RNA-binding protein with RPS1 domain